MEVSDGNGRNFRCPGSWPVEATADNLNTMKLQEKARKAEEARQKAAAEETAEKLKGLTVKIYAKSGKDGRLFGAITSKEISDALKEQHHIEIGQAEDRAGRADQGLRRLSDQMPSWVLRCPGTINLVVAEEK